MASDRSTTEQLLVLEPAAGSGDPVRRAVELAGGRVLQAYGGGAWVVDLPAQAGEAINDLPAVRGLFGGPVPDALTSGIDDAARLGIAAWNQRHQPRFRAAKRGRRGEGRSWGDPEFEREG